MGETDGRSARLLAEDDLVFIIPNDIPPISRRVIDTVSIKAEPQFYYDEQRDDEIGVLSEDFNEFMETFDVKRGD